MDLLCYGNRQEKICLEFYPCKNTGENISWESWHKTEPLTVFKTDYERLLLDYFIALYPLKDPTNNQIEKQFDVCFDNWIGKRDWVKLIKAIRGDIQLLDNSEEIKFYGEFLVWIERHLEWADIIVVDGNQ